MKFTSAVAAAAILVASAGLASAASQGSIGSTSIGSVSINITLAPVARISELNDLTLPQWNGTGDVEAFDDVCVYTNVPGGKYNITITGDGAGNSFELKDGNNKLPYQVTWNDKANSGGASLMRSGQSKNSLSGASTLSTDCNGGSKLNGRLSVKVPEETMLQAPAGKYAGTVTLTVAPE